MVCVKDVKPKLIKYITRLGLWRDTGTGLREEVAERLFSLSMNKKND